MANLTSQDDYIRTALRLPRDLHKEVQDSAEKNNRSMNAEIVARLEKSFIEEPIEPTSLAGIQQQIHGLVDENIKMRELLMEHLEFIGVTANSDEKSK